MMQAAWHPKYGEVEIVEITAGLSRIQTDDPRFPNEPFWVPTIALASGPPAKKNGKPVPRPLPLDCRPSNYEELAYYLRFSGDYSLYVEVIEGEEDAARRQYREWSGEELHESFVKPYPKKWCQEWFLIYPYAETVLSVLPLFASGTVGRGNGNKYPPHGLVAGGMIYVHFTEVIEALVREGLRPRLGRGTRQVGLF